MTYSTKSKLFVALIVVATFMICVSLGLAVNIIPARLSRAVPTPYELPTRPMIDRAREKRIDRSFELIQDAINMRHSHLPDGGCAGPGCHQ